MVEQQLLTRHSIQTIIIVGVIMVVEAIVVAVVVVELHHLLVLHQLKLDNFMPI